MSPSILRSTMLGKPVSRIEGPEKVRGRARYAAEIPVVGLRFALLLGSTVAHGRIKSMDTDAAEKIPGVVGVFTHRNFPPLGTDINTFPLGTAGTRLLPMQSDEILYEGQYVACVVGDSIEAAHSGLAAIRIDYEPLPVITFEGSLESDRPPEEVRDLNDVRLDFQQGQYAAHTPPEELPKFLADSLNTIRGDVEQGRKNAVFTVKAGYRTPPIYQSPIEIGATIAVPDDDTLTVYDATQHILGVRKFCRAYCECRLRRSG